MHTPAEIAIFPRFYGIDLSSDLAKVIINQFMIHWLESQEKCPHLGSRHPVNWIHQLLDYHMPGSPYMEIFVTEALDFGGEVDFWQARND